MHYLAVDFQPADWLSNELFWFVFIWHSFVFLCFKPFSHWTKSPLSPADIWLLSFIGKGTIVINSWVKRLLSSHGYISAPAPGNIPTECTLFQVSVSVCSASFSQRSDWGRDKRMALPAFCCSLFSDAFVTLNVTHQRKLKKTKTERQTGIEVTYIHTNLGVADL